MADVFTKAKRSEVMSKIRGHGNKATELALIRILRANGITGWRRRQRVFGKPDFVFPKRRVAVFVDGCFWHGCPKHGSNPKTNKTFWTDKFRRNKKRDKIVDKTLRSKGWRIVRIWEHDLKTMNEKCLLRKLKFIDHDLLLAGTLKRHPRIKQCKHLVINHI